MRFSYGWLRELVPGLDLPPAELARQITMKTAESEGVEVAGAHLSAVRAARVIAVEPIANSHNRKATVDTGDGGTKTVVCGAPNCEPGLVTAYVPPGTTLPDGKGIVTTMVGGVLSEGMLASGAELGVNREADQVLVLDGVQPGDSLAGCAPDHIIEIDNKSLTHRPDLWGHHGMAREVAAITGHALRDPVDLSVLPQGEPAVAVAIEDFALCHRYSALVVENVTVGPSPLWLQYRLESVGLNPINNLVDVTNFVMAELAQPMHAFDADRLQGVITARPGRAGEQLAALNGQTYELDSSALVIADEAGPVAIAGVIGGADSAIHSGTRRIVLESATFQASSVRKTSSRLKLRTDASMRFEKAQDPANTVRGLARAWQLLQQVSPGCRLTGGVADVQRPHAAAPVIALSVPVVQRKLGTAVAAEDVTRILTALEFGVERDDDRLRVTVPSWRATKDISLPDDLVEEVGRMVGYGNIPPVAPLVPAVVPYRDAFRTFQDGVRRLAASQGYDEVYNYSFLSEDEVRRFHLPIESHLRVRNPIASDQSLLRASLVPGIVRNLAENAKYFAAFRLFEVGREIHPRESEMPDEIPFLAAAAYSREGDGVAELMEAKRLLAAFRPDAVIQPVTETRAFEHPARTGNVLAAGRVVGRLFEVHPSFLKGRGAMLELDLRQLFELRRVQASYQPIRRTPSTDFDVSVVAPQRTLVGEIERVLRENGGAWLENVEYLRQFTGAPLAENEKSVSFRLVLAAPNRTLSSDEIGAVRSHVIAGLESAGYRLRG